MRWGRIGSAGQEKEFSFPNTNKAKTEADKLIAEKKKKGYVETDGAPIREALIDAADTPVALDIARDSIPAVADEQQQAELHARAAARLKALQA